MPGKVKALDGQFDLSGRLAVVTGAAGELCGTMAAVLAARGVKTVILDLDEEKAGQKAECIRAEGGEALAFGCNVLEEAELERCARAVEQRWGIPHILINGAGGNHPSGSVETDFFTGDLDRQDVKTFFNLPTEGFRNVLELNFFGTVLPTKVFARGMVEKGRGNILNMSSMSAGTPLTRVAAYSAAKAAVSNFTRWLAVYLAKTGVRVNALAPGFLMTEQLRFLHIDRETGEYTPRAKKVIAHTPMERYGEPDELIGAMLWLLSDASKFVTGTVIPIDGGFSSYTI
ncbi:MAG: SDR family oxidoreductase [Spirochaetales bacterium]|nr:SDR family oxidoreductase [Spirochaetales bacterium]